MGRQNVRPSHCPLSLFSCSYLPIYSLVLQTILVKVDHGSGKATKKIHTRKIRQGLIDTHWCRLPEDEAINRSATLELKSKRLLWVMNKSSSGAVKWHAKPGLGDQRNACPASACHAPEVDEQREWWRSPAPLPSSNNYRPCAARRFGHSGDESVHAALPACRVLSWTQQKASLRQPIKLRRYVLNFFECLGQVQRTYYLWVVTVYRSLKSDIQATKNDTSSNRRSIFISTSYILLFIYI